MDFGRIPVSKIDTILKEVLGVTDAELLEENREILMTADAAYLVAIRKKREKASGTAGRHPRPRPPR